LRRRLLRADAATVAPIRAPRPREAPGPDPWCDPGGPPLGSEKTVTIAGSSVAYTAQIGETCHWSGRTIDHERP